MIGTVRWMSILIGRLWFLCNILFFGLSRYVFRCYIVVLTVYGDTMFNAAQEEFLSHIRANRDRVAAILEYDPMRVRFFAAEHGMELTPDECDFLLRLLSAGLKLVDNDVK